MRILNDEKATVVSNQANKPLLVESVGSKVTTPAGVPDKVGRWKREIGRLCTTDEWLRDIVAFERVLFLQLQDVEPITYASLKWDNRFSVVEICS